MGSRSNYNTNGLYNTGRRVPPPRTGPSTFTSASDTLQDNLTVPTSRFNNPSSGDKSALGNPYVVRVIVMIDEATESGITDEQAIELRRNITNLLTNKHAPDMPRKTTPISPGDAVSFALRKRLKSDDEIAVLNTLVLLDEIMRSVPYFYRHIANEKFFRRLWRFVVPDYKNQMISLIPLFNKPKVHLGMQGQKSEITQRVLILIRAWAEELSVMLHGRFDPDAGFLIERYKNKRTRIPFPEVPKTSTPWVCPVSLNDGQIISTRNNHPHNLSNKNKLGGASSSASANFSTETMSLDEVENTVRLFSSLIDSARSDKDVKEDACHDLAERCKHINNNITNLSMNMSKEEELTRAVTISEILQRALLRYNSLLGGTAIDDNNNHNNEGSVGGGGGGSGGRNGGDPVSLESDDEAYHDAYSEDSGARISRNLRKSSTRSDSGAYDLKHGTRASRSRSDDDSHPSSKVDDKRRFADRRDRDHERARDRAVAVREDRIDRKKSQNRSRSTSRSRDSDFDSRRDRLKARVRDRREEMEENNDDNDDDRQESRKKRFDPPSTRKGKNKKYEEDEDDEDEDEDEKRIVKISQKRSGSRSSSSLKKGGGGDSKNGKKKVVKTDNLINVKDDEDEQYDDDDDDEDDDEDERAANEESFRLLAERYKVSKSKSKKSNPNVRIKKDLEAGSSADDVNAAAMLHQRSVHPGAAGMYATNAMGMNPMMMVPNPYAMYQSVNPMSMGMGMGVGMGMGMGMNDPMSMYNTHQSVNPAMLYQSMSPGMMNPMSMNGMVPGAAAVAQPPQQQQQLSEGAAEDNGDDVKNGNTGQPKILEDQQVQQQVGMEMMNVAAPSPSNQAAMYQSAMHQAATAYHMAANAYRTVSGQQPIGQSPGQQNAGGASSSSMKAAGSSADKLRGDEE